MEMLYSLTNLISNTISTPERALVTFFACCIFLILLFLLVILIIQKIQKAKIKNYCKENGIKYTAISEEVIPEYVKGFHLTDFLAQYTPKFESIMSGFKKDIEYILLDCSYEKNIIVSNQPGPNKYIKHITLCLLNKKGIELPDFRLKAIKSNIFNDPEDLKDKRMLLSEDFSNKFYLFSRNKDSVKKLFSNELQESFTKIRDKTLEDYYFECCQSNKFFLVCYNNFTKLEQRLLLLDASIKIYSEMTDKKQ